MAKLRPAVDAFFEKVKVNDENSQVRENRLKLLNEIRAATRAVADFSKISGLKSGHPVAAFAPPPSHPLSHAPFHCRMTPKRPLRVARIVQTHKLTQQGEYQ